MTVKKMNKVTPSQLYTVDERVQVWEDGARICHYCDKKLNKPGTKSGKSTHFDHVIPESKGGSHDLSNLVVCCKRCNTEKGNKDYITFLEDRSAQAKTMIKRMAYLKTRYRLKHG